MDLIEVLWKQDVDLGFTLDPATTNKNNEIDDNEKKKEEAEKIIPLDNVNSTDEVNFDFFIFKFNNFEPKS